MFTPKKSLATIEFLEANKNLKALHVMVDCGEFCLDEFRKRADNFNGRMRASGGQYGFGIATFIHFPPTHEFKNKEK